MQDLLAASDRAASRVHGWDDHPPVAWLASPGLSTADSIHTPGLGVFDAIDAALHVALASTQPVAAVGTSCSGWASELAASGQVQAGQAPDRRRMRIHTAVDRNLHVHRLVAMRGREAAYTVRHAADGRDRIATALAAAMQDLQAAP